MRPSIRTLHRHVATSLILVLACGSSAQPSRAAAEAAAPCGDESCSSYLSCGLATGYEEVWFRVDAIGWQLSGTDLPPLVTAAPAGVPLNVAGRLDQGSTEILAGGEAIGDRMRAGFALSGGYWLDPYAGWGVTAEYFNAGRDSYGFVGGPGDGRTIARPFFNAQTGAQDAMLIDAPAEKFGRVNVAAYDNFQGAAAELEARVWERGVPGDARRANVSLVGGYRYYQHDSRLSIDHSFTVLPGATTALPGTIVAVSDRFAARNQFNGFELGLKGRWQQNQWWVDGAALVAFGGNRRVVFVEGGTAQFVPGVGLSSGTGGLLVSDMTNMGRYADTDGAIIPRFRVGGGYNLTKWLSVKAGYNVIIWDDVTQAGSHLPANLAVDPRNLFPVTAGGGPDPVFPGIRGTNLVAHGLDFGAEIAF